VAAFEDQLVAVSLLQQWQLCPRHEPLHTFWEARMRIGALNNTNDNDNDNNEIGEMQHNHHSVTLN
jgi:hypothetical protein